MSGDTSQSQYYARVLDIPIRVKQFRTNGPHARLQGQADHFVKPAGGDDLDVVVDQRHQRSTRLFDGGIVKRRKIERAVITPYRYIGLHRYLSKIFKGFLLIRTVIDYQDLVVGIGRFLPDAVHTVFQQPVAIAGWNNQRHQRRLGRQLVAGPDTGGRTFNGCYCSRSVEMLLQRPGTCVDGVGFFTQAARSASRVPAPVIQHPGNMHDIFRFDGFDKPQRQVVVLCPFQPLPESPDILDDVPTVYPQVADHIVRIEQVPVEVAFEIGLKSVAASADLVFVREDQAGLRVKVDGFHHAKERMLGQQIIMVHQGDPFAFTQRQRTVGCGRDVAVLSAKCDLDPLVL